VFVCFRGSEDFPTRRKFPVSPHEAELDGLAIPEDLLPATPPS
jgi:hypothetical protein